MEGIERIQKMAEGQKNHVLLEIVKYLIGRVDLNDKYLNEEKTLKGMAEYINGEILKDFCEKMNTTNPASFSQNFKYKGQTVKCVAHEFSNEKTFELAANYFRKSNKELGIELEEVKKIETKKKEIKNNVEKNNELGSIFGSIFDSVQAKQEDGKNEQISLFGM